MKLILITAGILLLLPNFINIQLGSNPSYDNKEQFNPHLSYINSTQKLIEVADSVAKQKSISQGSLQYAVMLTGILRERFYHGFSRYPVNENWIAVAAEYLFGYGLAYIVKPDDILKYNFGGCSQQSIVLMEVMKRKNISYRSVGFPHHYSTELKLNNNWYYFDPNMEPNIPDSERIASKWTCCADNLKKYYDTSRFPDLDWKFGNGHTVKLGKVDAPPAPNAFLFQSATGYISKSLWIFPLFLAFYPRKKKLK